MSEGKFVFRKAKTATENGIIKARGRLYIRLHFNINRLMGKDFNKVSRKPNLTFDFQKVMI